MGVVTPPPHVSHGGFGLRGGPFGFSGISPRGPGWSQTGGYFGLFRGGGNNPGYRGALLTTKLPGTNKSWAYPLAGKKNQKKNKIGGVGRKNAFGFGRSMQPVFPGGLVFFPFKIFWGRGAKGPTGAGWGETGHHRRSGFSWGNTGGGGAGGGKGPPQRTHVLRGEAAFVFAFGNGFFPFVCVKNFRFKAGFGNDSKPGPNKSGSTFTMKF